jgi:hypothetical protein
MLRLIGTELKRQVHGSIQAVYRALILTGFESLPAKI